MKKLFAVTLLNVAISVTMFYAYTLTGSSALLAEAFHNASDSICLLFSTLLTLSKYSKAKALSALLNGLFVTFASTFVMLRAIRGNVTGGDVIAKVSAVALLINAVGWALLRSDDLSLRAMRLHLANDSLFSGIVIVAGLAVSKGLVFVDRLVAIMISTYMLVHGLKIVLESLRLM